MCLEDEEGSGDKGRKLGEGRPAAPFLQGRWLSRRERKDHFPKQHYIIFTLHSFDQPPRLYLCTTQSSHQSVRQ